MLEGLYVGCVGRADEHGSAGMEELQIAWSVIVHLQRRGPTGQPVKPHEMKVGDRAWHEEHVNVKFASLKTENWSSNIYAASRLSLPPVPPVHLALAPPLPLLLLPRASACPGGLYKSLCHLPSVSCTCALTRSRPHSGIFLPGGLGTKVYTKNTSCSGCNGNVSTGRYIQTYTRTNIYALSIYHMFVCMGPAVAGQSWKWNRRAYLAPFFASCFLCTTSPSFWGCVPPLWEDWLGLVGYPQRMQGAHLQLLLLQWRCPAPPPFQLEVLPLPCPWLCILCHFFFLAPLHPWSAMASRQSSNVLCLAGELPNSVCMVQLQRCS